MSIFQKSVINNHLSQLDNEQVNKAFEKFNENYSFSKITEIQKMKEEEYQVGFLRDIFVDVFGYTLKPADNYNLAREYKNQTDGKKADGAILKNDKAIAVIELKSTKTKDLTNLTQQTFNYKNNQPECKYVITSNFQKLRFYINYSNEYEEFDLFNLQKDNFQLLYLLLQKDSILNDLPLKLKTETKFHEENISDKLYKDYSSFKYKIYNNLVKNNPQYDKLTLFKKSQKFLDRLLFVFFAEDTGLVPPNAISKIVEQWQVFIDNDEYFSLYSRFVKFFIHFDKGHKYKTYDLPAYNGGLFAPDEILDSITIDDEVLKNDALLLSSYDYSTEVDVNILGHIFEHSLNEIESVAAEISATTEHAPLSISKRKKDGVFYTPKYITQYIVENTIGKLCIEKREKLGILEIEFDESIKTKNGKISVTGKKLFETLQAYKDWLFSLKIVDPACGSGAFLNQALNFLINEHKQIDDIIAELTGEKLRLFDTDKTILEKNLYGVDINDESVEIAKLSLWLRTAQKGRKLSNLNNNIKCGNSLIDDPEVAGEKAFNWQKEFPNIFQKKEKKAWHVTWVTHDTRTSERMIKYKVRERRANGEMHVDRSIYLEDKDALKVTEIISNIIVEEKYNCLAYNIGEDHVHILLVCDEEELTNIVRKLKGKSAQKFKEHLGLAKDETFNLWAQKFDRKLISSEEQFANTIEYIEINRIKHNLPDINKGLQPLVQKMTCAREHAFRTEYTGGFDVVIANPPYLRVQGLRDNFADETIFYETKYKSATGRFDIYILFIEKAFGLIKDSGKVSFILPHKFMVSDFGEGIRHFLIEKKAVEKIVHFGAEMVFADASTYTCILCLSKQNKIINYKEIKPTELLFESDFELVDYKTLDKNKWNLQSQAENRLFEKLKKQPQTVKSVFENISQGVVSVGDDIFLMKGEIKGDKFIGYSDKIRRTITIEAETVRPILKGEDVKKYAPLENTYFCLYPHSVKNGKTVPYEETFFKEKYPLAYNYILPFKDELIAKKIRYKTNPTAWYSLHRSREMALFEQEKIITPEISLGTNMTIDLNNLYHNTKCYTLAKLIDIEEDNKFWLAILNSKLLWYFLSSTGYVLRGGFFTFKTKYLEPFPLPKLNDIEKQNPVIEKVNIIINKTAVFKNTLIQFLQLLQNKFEIENPSTKLQNWHNLEFKDFLKELQKAKIKLSLSEEAEWMNYFNEQKEIAQRLQSEIEKTDKEIDQMVYQLYDLTEDEIAIVENSIK